MTIRQFIDFAKGLIEILVEIFQGLFGSKEEEEETTAPIA